MSLPSRKPHRLPDFSYNTPGAYFITFCVKDRSPVLWTDAGACIARPLPPPLSVWGKIVDKAIRDIPSHYPSISVDHYVVMPNHVHLLLQVNTDQDGQPLPAPTISVVVQQLKGVVTKQIGYSIWQKLFHDHVIRGQRDYLKIWEYIDGNPSKWEEDCFYTAGHTGI